ncbi:hypothetical protein LDENG_00104540 [Lucifuga dentata]|nr:hypothetical protein LDENG_00104540 [Lucifuga dentata]
MYTEKQRNREWSEQAQTYTARQILDKSEGKGKNQRVGLYTRSAFLWSISFSSKLAAISPSVIGYPCTGDGRFRLQGYDRAGAAGHQR